MRENSGRLVVTCHDRPGVVAAVSRFLFAQDANITGSDIERTVLRRAVQWHCEDRVLRDGTSTVVF